jgi:hypothetical protein
VRPGTARQVNDNIVTFSGSKARFLVVLFFFRFIVPGRIELDKVQLDKA